MKAFDYIPLYTYKDYKLWEGEWELIHGYPHAMSPSANRKHQFINTQLSHHIISLLKSKFTVCNDCEVYQDLDWIIDDSNVVRPDLMIVCGDFKEEFLGFPPVLIVEILSKSTSMKDRNIKYNLYQSQQVKYYVLVNPESKTCEIFELKSGEYELRTNDDFFSLHKDCKLQLDIPGFIASLNLS
ncbi:MAG TPA: Uma2 family endonuclease [Chitinophagales bacterium]|nr:Uma2 family endonuclease [Chitinophagales bacterium]